MSIRGLQMNEVLAGVGTSVNIVNPIEGTLFEINGADETLALLDRIESGEVEFPIILVHEAGGTTIGPLFGAIRGLVSTEGGVGSHIAILAKEFGCACIVAARFDQAISTPINVRLDSNGGIVLIEGQE